MKIRQKYLFGWLLAVILICAFALAGCNLPFFGAKTYTVVYRQGQGLVTGAAPASQSYAAGQVFTLPEGDVFSRENCELVAWNDGEKDYETGKKYTMPAKNVVFTAQWRSTVESELPAEFYRAENWVYMTNNGGSTLDSGGVPYVLADGSIKFHYANQAVKLGERSNETTSFLLKGTNNWSIWFNSDSCDNSSNFSYRLTQESGQMKLSVASRAAARLASSYRVGEWNRFDIDFKTANGVCTIEIKINGEVATMSALTQVSGVTVNEKALTCQQSTGTGAGVYFVVKVWDAQNFLRIKPIAQGDVEDVPVVACVGDSITAGAGAGNYFTESYPAQLQQAVGGDYNVVNFGNSGKTARTDLKENGVSVAWLAQNEWIGFQSMKPDVLILGMGSNDSKTSNAPLSTYSTFRAAYEHLLDRLLSVNPDMEVIISTAPTAYSNIWAISQKNIEEIIVPVQTDVAAERGYTLVDLQSYTKNKSLLFGDGIHPTSYGYSMFAKIFARVLTYGEEGLDDAFLDGLDEEYNDVISDVTARLEVNGDKIQVVVTGNTTLTSSGRIRLQMESGAASDPAPVEAVVLSGKFTADFDLTKLDPAAGWYNVRVYTDDVTSYRIQLKDTPYRAGEQFSAGNTNVTVMSWTEDEGSGRRTIFSLALS